MCIRDRSQGVQLTNGVGLFGLVQGVFASKVVCPNALSPHSGQGKQVVKAPSWSRRLLVCSRVPLSIRGHHTVQYRSTRRGKGEITPKQSYRGVNGLKYTSSGFCVVFCYRKTTRCCLTLMVQRSLSFAISRQVRRVPVQSRAEDSCPVKYEGHVSS